ncbi:MAG: transposase [Deltaproteobacteria bacterium]|nr:transposase [Deltaproteobacteria bacterium]
MIRYRLTRPWPTPAGKTELLFEPHALLRRLAALLPGPYLNLTRYYGVFANRSRFRLLLPPPPAPPGTSIETTPPPATVGIPTTQRTEPRPRRLGWAQLLRRVLYIDVLTCAKCAVPMTVIAFLSDPQVVEQILGHLALPSTPPLLAKSTVTTTEDVFIRVSMGGWHLGRSELTMFGVRASFVFGTTREGGVHATTAAAFGMAACGIRVSWSRWM